MHINSLNRFGLSGASLPQLCTVLLVLALAGTITAGVLEFGAQRNPPEPVQPVTVGDMAARTARADVAPIARLLGAQPGADASNIKLMGVIAQGGQGHGVAVLTVDGRAPVALRAGDEIAMGTVLSEVGPDRIVVSRSGAVQEIILPGQSIPQGIIPVR